jgi:hypothetical protein
MTRFLPNVLTTKELGYGRCFLVYVIVFVALFIQLCGGARVISPVRQGDFLGSAVAGTSHRPENAKFSDYVTYAIPEATAFLDGKRSGWITTWMPYNELGRPTLHLSGLSPAYFPNWILSKFTTDAFVYVTAIATLAMFLAGAFMFLLARELELQPAAALVAALAVGLSPTLIYWATFPMFASAYGWSAAALYGLVRFVRRRDLLAWSVIAFAIYSLLMTAYPIMVVYHAYMAVGFLVYLGLRHPDFPREGRKLARLMAGLASAAAFGILAAAPALTDTFLNTLQSARFHPDVSFLRANIPSLRSAADWSTNLAFWTFPQLFGSPISPAFPAQFIGRSLAPFAVFLVCASNWRRTWGWWLATLVLVAADAFPAVFAFAVNYLGLGLSRSVPTVHAIIPLAMIAATSLDSALGGVGDRSPPCEPRVPHRPVPIAWSATLYLLLIANAVMAGRRLNVAIDYPALIAFVAYLPLLLLAVRRRLAGLVIAVALIHLAIFDRHQLLIQQRSAIVQSTPVTQRLHDLLADGGRYAIVDSTNNFMPPNMNAQMELASVHTYDSLSPLRYQALIHRLGGDVSDHGRFNRSIEASSIGSIDFHLANIGALVAQKPLESKAITLDVRLGGLFLYRVLERWGGYTRFNLDAVVFDSDSARISDASTVEKQAATVVADRGDRVDLRLTRVGARPTLLVASQTYHADWQAEGRYPGGWHTLHTLPVDDAFEGIIIPPGCDFIRLRFRPWIRWSWLGHIGFGMLGLLLAYAWSRGRRQRVSRTAGA